MEEVYEICVGYLRREPSAALHITFLDLDIMIKAQHERDQDAWDYTRHIMAAMGAGDGDVLKLIHLDRDDKKREISPELLERAKQFANRMRTN